MDWLQRMWYKYVNADHFLIGAIAVLLLVWAVWWVAGLVLLIGGFLHELDDGDLFGPPKVHPAGAILDPPWEGIKDAIWFLIPLLLRLLL